MAAELNRYKTGSIDEVLRGGNTTTRDIDEIGNITLLNNKGLQSKKTSGEIKNLVRIDPFDTVTFGASDMPAYLKGTTLELLVYGAVRLSINNIPFQQKDNSENVRQLLKLNSSNVLEIGDTNNEMELQNEITLPNNKFLKGIDTGSVVHPLIGVTSADIVRVGSSGHDILINSDDNLILNPKAIVGIYPNNMPLKQRDSGGDYRQLLKLNSSDVLEIGDSNNPIYCQNEIRLLNNTAIKFESYGGGTFYNLIKSDTSSNITIGPSNLNRGMLILYENSQNVWRSIASSYPLAIQGKNSATAAADVSIETYYDGNWQDRVILDADGDISLCDLNANAICYVKDTGLTLPNNVALQGLNTGELLKNLIKISNFNQILVGHSGSYIGIQGGSLGELPPIDTDVNIDETKRIYSGTYGRPFSRIISFAERHIHVESGSVTDNYEPAQQRLEISGIDDGDDVYINIPVSQIINQYSGSSSSTTRLSSFKFWCYVYSVSGSGYWIFMRCYKRSPTNYLCNSVASNSTYFTSTGYTNFEITIDANMDEDYLYTCEIEIYGRTGLSGGQIWLLQSQINGYEEL